MATLNTLRTRGGVVLSVVIGIALLAFLLGDMTSVSGLINSKKTRVGTIEGANISYVEFLTLSDNTTNVLQTLYGKSAFTAEETDQMRQSVWESLIIKNAYMPGFNKLGLGVGDDEMTDMSKGEYLSPIVSGVFSNPQTGAYDPSILQNFVSSLEYNKEYVPVWNYLKDQMLSERAMSKFVSLVEAGVYVNNLEVENAVAMASQLTSATYYAKNYSQVADSLVKVSKADVTKYYKAHKSDFKQQSARDIEYVVFDLLPSESDYADAQKVVDGIAAEFAEAEEPMQYASLNSQVKTDSRYYKESELPANYVSIAFGNGGKMYGPVLAGDTYTMARVSDIKMLPDTIGAKHILLEATNKTSTDSIVKALKGGASFAELAAAYSLDKSYDLGHFAPEQMIPAFSEACLAAKVGDIFTVESQYGLHVVNLTYKSAPVKKAQVAVVVYNVEPSSFTQQSVYAQARDFVEKAGKTYESFDAAVASTGAARRTATVSNQERSVNGLKESRELVRWAFNGKKGEVSSILDVDGDYVVASVKDVREAGNASEAQVYDAIYSKLLNLKKADYINAEVAGKADSELEAQGFKSGSIENLAYASFYIQGLGMEPKLVGAVCATPAGKGGRVDGAEGVYVYAATAKTPVESVTAEDERVRLEAMAQTYLNERLSKALDDESEITDNRVKFF